MKISLRFLLVCCLAASSTLAQVAQPGGRTTKGATATVIESGPDYRSWQRLDPARAATPRSGRMVEMATGLNYWDGTNWTESVPQFELSTQEPAFVANQVQHRVRLNSDINVAGAVAVSTPEGQILYSTPVGIGLYDAASGKFLLLATITNTAGVLVNSNQVYFENAFRGGACASILYTIERNSFAQDIVFSGYLDPAAYGFPTNSTHIQIITEFFQPPVPDVLRQPMAVETNPLLRQAMASPDLMDETLTFGKLVIGVGQAYTLPSLLEPAGAASLVAKEFTQTADGRHFLIESVPYRTLQKGFYSLPDCPQTGPTQGAVRRGTLKSMLAAIPAPPSGSKAKVEGLRLPGHLAQGVLPKGPSVIIDYRATLNSGATLVQGDTTYLISGIVACTTLTIEGGAVLKYKVGASMTVNSITQKNSGLYRPVVFTGVDDDTVGDSMNGYSGSGYIGSINSSGYANPALGLSQLSLTASGCVFRYAQKAIQYAATSISAATITLTHAQLYKCIRGIDLTWAGCGCCGGSGTISLTVNNAVMAGVQYPVYYANLSCTVNPSLINCTVDQAANLVGGSGTLTYNAINSVFANITNSTSGTFSGNNNGFYNSAQSFGTAKSTVSSSPFQSVGAGNYYLTDASGFRTAGTSSGVSGSMLTDLGKRTTYPPLVVAVFILNTPTTYFPQAQRNTGTLDLGYHYDPLDWAMSGVFVTNATLTITPGTAIATFGTNAYTYGLGLAGGGQIMCVGSPDKPIHIVEYNTVQEQYGSVWKTPTVGSVTDNFVGSPLGLTFQFTDWCSPAEDVQHLNTTGSEPQVLRDSQFHGGQLTIYTGFQMTNCLLERVYADLEPQSSPSYIRNCTVWGGTFILAPSTTNALAMDNLFDTASIPNYIGGSGLTYVGAFNAYVTNNDRLKPTLATDIILPASPSYQVGPLGNYYQLTSSVLINADTNTHAQQVGLYHYTVTTNLTSGYEIKETNSLLDVSYHYVATDANGNPIDTNGDGIPDYLSDINGNGTVDSGEVGWNLAGDLGLKVLITRPRNGSVLP